MSQTACSHLSASPTALLQMHHPEFRRGYQRGRDLYFEQEAATPFSDKELMQCLKGMAEDGCFSGSDEAGAYYTLGELIGQLSGVVIPRQPDECGVHERQERLLARLRKAYGESEETERLISAITTMWQAQDYLATLLNLEDYQRVQSRDMRLSL